MPIHSWWNQTSHESQQTPGVLYFTALLQTAHGNFIGRGPGFGSGAYDSVNKRLHKYSKTCFLRQIGPSAFDRVHFIATTNWAGNENDEVWLFLSVVTVIRVLYSSLTRTTLHNKIVHVKVSVKYIRNIASSCLPDVYNSAKNCG
jgi:hypothetical protein